MHKNFLFYTFSIFTNYQLYKGRQFSLLKIIIVNIKKNKTSVDIWPHSA